MTLTTPKNLDITPQTIIDMNSLYKSSLQRIIVGDYATSICLYDQILESWSGGESHGACALVKSIIQFSSTVGGGDIKKVVMRPFQDKNQQSTRRIKSIFQDSDSAHIKSASSSRFSLNLHDSTMIIIEHREKKVYCGLFVGTTDEIVKFSHEVASKICELFISKFGETINDEAFRKLLSDLKEGKVVKEDESENTILERFLSFKEDLTAIKLL